MLSILQTWVYSVAIDQTHGWNIWSITNLIAVRNSDVKKVGKRSHNTANVLKQNAKPVLATWKAIVHHHSEEKHTLRVNAVWCIKGKKIQQFLFRFESLGGGAGVGEGRTHFNGPIYK